MNDLEKAVDNSSEEVGLIDRFVRVPRSLYSPGLLLDAADSTGDWYFDPRDAEVWMGNMHRVQLLLDPPQITKPDADYQDRIKVTFRMLEMIPMEWGRNDIIYAAGNSLGDLAHICYYAGDGWELGINRVKPDNIFVLGYQHEPALKEIISRHQNNEDIFGENGLEFLMPAFRGWKVPIIGVKKLIYFDADKKYTLTPGKIESSKSSFYSCRCKPLLEFGENGRFCERKD